MNARVQGLEGQLRFAAVKMARSSRLWSCTLLLRAGLALTSLHAADANDTGPWRLIDGAGLPDWIDISGTQRTRYETLDGQFRAGRSGGDQMLAFRTTLRLEGKSEHFRVVGSDTDAWTTSGLRDPAGHSGTFVGHQLEARLRWDVLSGNARLEVGGAYLFAGEFIKNAPNATSQGDTAYGYLSLEVSF